MGKAYKQEKNRLRKAGLLKGDGKRGGKKPGVCFVSGCPHPAGETFECITCEKLVAKGKRKSVYGLPACVYHRETAYTTLKQHALAAHPVNILRGTMAVLKGEDLG